jgi:NAD/NADP transhydrogenase beta subunit
VVKQTNSGFAGIDNPLFNTDHTSMVFGDPKNMASQGHR